MSAQVLPVGETMALLDPQEEDMGTGNTFRLRVGGAESSFAIALTRLGVQVAWVSRLGTDPFGDLVARTLAAEGVDLRYLRRDPERPTGIYFKSRSGGRTRMVYYRSGRRRAACRPLTSPTRRSRAPGWST